MRSFAILMTLSITGSIQAAEPIGNSIEEITIYGENNTLSGKPSNATEGLIHDTQFTLRPISRPAELLEFVPGLIATQHSGEGKGNQYFLRGFNLDHGTDLALRVDGLPVNMPSHAHGQGYADLNFLIPELIERMEYRKGPYYAEVGDFGTAASSDFYYVDGLQEGVASLTFGENDYTRAFAGYTFDAFAGKLTIAGAQAQYAGPWQLDQDLDKSTGLVKYHQRTTLGSWSISASAYDNTWNATDQIPLRAVQNGTLARFATIDDSDGGDTHRHSLALDWQQSLESSAWSFNAFAIDYGRALYSKFTYFLEDPVRGDQFEQAEDRRVYGFHAQHQRDFTLAGLDSTLSIGLQNRSDIIDVGLYQTQKRLRYSSTREDKVKQSLNSLYASLDTTLSAKVRSVVALRTDYFNYDVNADLISNSGSGSDALISPKLNLIYAYDDQTEFFLSAGRGFHSNDARGTTITVDPANGNAVDKVDPLAKALSYELGMRTAAFANTQLAISLFSMKLDSELLYIGDAGNTEALGASKRRGIELGALYAPTPWLLIDADLTMTKARLLGSGVEPYIPNSVERTASLGLILENIKGWSGGLRLRYLGEAPLTEDNSVQSDPTLLLNAQAIYQLSSAWSLGLEVMNLTDSRDNDITYFYESQLASEAQPYEDIHFHPVEPRSVRLTLRATF